MPLKVMLAGLVMAACLCVQYAGAAGHEQVQIKTNKIANNFYNARREWAARLAC